MALINCPDCGRKVSDKAPQCPECGRPIRKFQRTLNFTLGFVSATLLAIVLLYITPIFNKPDLKAHILNLYGSPYKGGIPLVSPSKVTVTKDNSTMLFPFVVIGNQGNEPITIYDYELELDLGNGWEKAERATDADLCTWVFRFPDHTMIARERSSSMLKPLVKLEKGKPVHGFLVFIITKPFSLIKKKASELKYKFTCLDESGKRYESIQEKVPGLNIAYLTEISNLNMIWKRLSDNELVTFKSVYMAY